MTRGLIEVIRRALPLAEIECVALPTPGRAAHLSRQLRSIVQSTFGGRLPAKAAFTRTVKLRSRLNASLAMHRPDLVIINGSDLFWVLTQLPEGIPVVAFAQNIEQELYARQIARSPIERLLEQDLRKLRQYEWAGMRKAGRVIFLSHEDCARALDACPGIDALVLPPVFDYEPARRADWSGGPLRIGMFADFTWWPNRVSLDWFLNNVWDFVSSDLQLHLMGHGSNRAAPGMAAVVAHGSVNDARDAFTKADLMIAPIIDGAGVKVKVAEALYNRLPIAATSFATRGLPVRATAAVRICDTADEWIAFLSGDEPAALARRPVPAEAAACFSAREAADHMRRFLNGSPLAQQSGPRHRTAC